MLWSLRAPHEAPRESTKPTHPSVVEQLAAYSEEAEVLKRPSPKSTGPHLKSFGSIQFALLPSSQQESLSIPAIRVEQTSLPQEN